MRTSCGENRARESAVQCWMRRALGHSGLDFSNEIKVEMSYAITWIGYEVSSYDDLCALWKHCDRDDKEKAACVWYALYGLSDANKQWADKMEEKFMGKRKFSYKDNEENNAISGCFVKTINRVKTDLVDRVNGYNPIARL